MTFKAPIRIARFLGNVLIVIFGLGTLGAFVPTIPLLGEMGPILISRLGPWITVLSLIGVMLVFRRWRKNVSRRTLVLVGLAAFAMVGTAYVQAKQIKAATANGVHIDLAQTFLARSQADDSLRPVTVIYSEFDGEKLALDVYRPSGSHPSNSAPVLVYIHGGGWGAETLKQRQADYRWFAERGYLVISLEYPLSSETRHTWNVAQPQLGCALAWIGDNVARHGGDPSRLALWGESAGGNLVINVSYMANAGTLMPSCEGALPQVDATIGLYPVVDPARMHHNEDPLIGVFGRMMTVRYTGGTPEQFPDRYAMIASSTHISDAAPATLLIVPEADHLVVPEAAYDFARRARAAGIQMRVIRMPFAEHAFDLRSGSIGNQLVRQVMFKFLADHGLEP